MACGHQHEIVCLLLVQGTLGASTVILPGVSIGAQATLAPLAVPTIGSIIKPKATYMGVPASAVKVSIDVELVGSTAYRVHLLA